MDIVKWHANERAGLPDFTAATGPLVLDEQIRLQRTLFLPGGRTTGAAATSARVFSGFELTDQGSGIALLTSGIGIFPLNDDGTIQFGIPAGEQAPASYQLDFSSAPDDTYVVYVRYVYADGDAQNRVFWNAATNPPTEEVDNVATRRILTWEAIYRSVSSGVPGIGEYVPAWRVTVVSSAISATADYRHYFFEGSAEATDNYATEWGDGANDRDADRAAHGVKDWHDFSQMLRRQLSDIIDPHSTSPAHFKSVVLGLSQMSSRGYYDTDCIVQGGPFGSGNDDIGQYWQGWTTGQVGSPTFDRASGGWRNAVGLKIAAPVTGDKGSIFRSMSPGYMEAADLPGLQVAWYASTALTEGQVAMQLEHNTQALSLVWAGATSNETRAIYFDGTTPKTVVLQSGIPSASVLHVGRIIVRSLSRFTFQVWTIDASDNRTLVADQTFDKDGGQIDLAGPARIELVAEHLTASGTGPTAIFHHVRSWTQAFYP